MSTKIAYSKISAGLWFDRQAQEAVNFYCTVFKNAIIHRTTHYGKAGFEIHRMPEGTVMTIEFELEGQRFEALNGGPAFRFNEAISFIIHCDSQEEIDYYWTNLSAGGDPKAQVCGWLKDRFGVSWQIVPAFLAHIWEDKESAGRERAMTAMLQMKKLDAQILLDAYNG